MLNYTVISDPVFDSVHKYWTAIVLWGDDGVIDDMPISVIRAPNDREL